MAIAVTCSGCNRSMRVKDDFAGRRALCPFCKAEVLVPEQEQPRAKEEYALVEEVGDGREEPRRRPRLRDDEEADRDDDKPRRRPRLRDEEADLEVRKKRSGGGTSSGSVLTGILMMVGALIWFFGALALGTIFFYPPILFIIGLVTFIKGLSGGSD